MLEHAQLPSPKTRGSENAEFLSAVNHYFHNMSCTTTVARIRQDNVYHDTGDMNIYEMCMTTRCDAKYHDDRAPLPSRERLLP